MDFYDETFCDDVSVENMPDKFIFARDLIMNKSKKDPPDNPYKSKYEARNILLSLEEFLLDYPVSGSTAVENKLAVIYYLLGGIHIDVEEPSKGTEYSYKAIATFSHNAIHPDSIVCFLSTLNVLGFACCKYEKLDESLDYLDKALAAYNSYKERYAEVTPKEFCEIFGKPIEEEKNGFEKAHTSTLFYLAQVHSSRKDRLKSAKYCHTTLKRQLQFKEYDTIDWSLNSATLSQYLIEQNAFREAKNHLAMAQALLEKCSEEYDMMDDHTEEVKAMKESLSHRTADVFRCWAKYGIYLLTVSKDRLLTSEGDRLDPVPQPPEEIRGLFFTGIEVERVNEYESSVTSDFLLTYEDAKPVFLASQEWLNKAKSYYTLDDHASDYVSILQDSSQLYHVLAFFQHDEATQCKLHKRRLDMLDKVVNALNPTYYLNVCRDLWYELGEICLYMADLKRSQGESDHSNDAHFFSKSQQFYGQGIKYFEKYLESFKFKNKNGTIERYPEDCEKNILMAYMFLGRMYSKLTSQEKMELVKTQTASLKAYRTVMEYCSIHKDITEIIPDELSICREMVQLLPLKIAKIDRYM